jgi:hypothetical protein
MAQEATQGEVVTTTFALRHQNNDATLSALILDQEQALADTSPLTRNEEQMLQNCETIIKQTVNSFFQLGEALAVIRRMRLYRAQYSSFEEYCRKKWNFGRQRATQLIQAHNAAAEVVTSGYQVFDLTERQMRPLTGLEPNVRAEVLDKATELAAGKRRTTRHIQDALKAIQSKDQPAEEEMVELEILQPKTNSISTAVEMPTVTEDMLTGCFDEIDELLERIEYSEHLHSAFAKLRSMVKVLLNQANQPRLKVA